MSYNKRHIVEYDFSDSGYYTNPASLLSGYELPFTGWYEFTCVSHTGSHESPSRSAGLRIYLESMLIADSSGSITPPDSTQTYGEHFYISPVRFYADRGDYLYIYGWDVNNYGWPVENAWAILEYLDEVKEL